LSSVTDLREVGALGSALDRATAELADLGDRRSRERFCCRLGSLERMGEVVLLVPAAHRFKNRCYSTTGVRAGCGIASSGSLAPVYRGEGH